MSDNPVYYNFEDSLTWPSIIGDDFIIFNAFTTSKQVD